MSILYIKQEFTYIYTCHAAQHTHTRAHEYTEGEREREMHLYWKLYLTRFLQLDQNINIKILN